jgi:alpha-beta hydrolase superfamily lysophospholipase
VIAPDLMPAHGGLAVTTFDDYAAQVRAWREPCASACVMMGASLGGLLALHVAGGIAPAALVLINPLPPAGISQRPSRKDFPDIVPWGRERSLDSTRRAMPVADEAARLFAFRRWRDESGTVLRAAAQGIAAASVRCPMLIVASENDADVAADASRALATHFAAEFRLLKGASHVGPLLGRSANAVAADVLGWCEHVIARGKV